MSDFQYLAMHSGPDGKQTSMYDKVLMLKPEKEEFFNRELPLYIPPPIFSRLDTPVDYFYRPDIQHRSVPFLMIYLSCISPFYFAALCCFIPLALAQQRQKSCLAVATSAKFHLRICQVRGAGDEVKMMPLPAHLTQYGMQDTAPACFQRTGAKDRVSRD